MNGEEWKGLGDAKNSNNEISLSSYIAGAEVLGSTVRYVKLRAVNRPGKATIKIYAK